MVRIALIALLVAAQVLIGIPDCLYEGAPFLRCALSYSFFHANWWHLAVNGLAVWSIYRPQYMKLMKGNGTRFIISLAIAFIVYPLSFRPVIGFSNVLYAELGLRTPSLKSRWWRQTPVIVFLAVTLALLFVPRFSATTHIAAFLLGMAGSAVSRSYKRLTEDARRYL